MRIAAPWVLVMVFLFPSVTLAQRPQPHNLQDPKLTRAQQANEYYRLGQEAIDKAIRLEAELENTIVASNEEKTTKKIERTWKKAVNHLTKATKTNPEMFQAHMLLGEAYYGYGDYEAALASCDRTVEIAPNLNDAIYSRVRTYLALDRPEGAKRDYTTLARREQETAPDALEAIKAWVEMRRQNPAGVDSGTLDELQIWIDGL